MKPLETYQKCVPWSRPGGNWVARKLVRAVWGTLFVGFLGIVPDLAAEPFGSRFDGFLLLLEDRELRPTEESEWFRGRFWGNAVLIVLGDPPENMQPSPRQLLRDGASILVANDRSSPWMARLPEYGVRAVLPPLGSNTEYFEGIEACPIAQVPAGISHPLLKGVDQILLNRSGWLDHPPHSRTDLAFLTSAYPIAGSRRVPVLAVDRVGIGRIAILTDQSPFTNDMILEHGGTNLRLASNLMDWLVQGRRPDDLHVAVIANGQWVRRWVDPRFETGEWASPTLADLAEAINTVLVTIQEEDRGKPPGLYNELMVDYQSMVSRPMVRAWMLVLPASLAIWFLLGRFRQPRAGENEEIHAEVAVAADRRAVGPRAPSLAESRLLAHAVLEAWGSELAFRSAAGAMTFWDRWMLRPRLRRLASGRSTRPLTPRTFEQLRTALRETAMQDGDR